MPIHLILSFGFILYHLVLMCVLNNDQNLYQFFWIKARD